MWTQQPSKKQKEVLDFVNNFQKKKGYPPSLKEIASYFEISIPTVHQHLKYLKNKGLINKKKGKKRSLEIYSPPKNELVRIPLLGTISAGGPIEPIENPEPLDVPKHMLSKSGRHYALKVSGTSMMEKEEGIFDGDIVIVREQPVVENGEKAVAYLPGENKVTLKKIYKEKNRIRLQPANKDMDPLYAKNVEVQGKVISVLRKMK